MKQREHLGDNPGGCGPYARDRHRMAKTPLPGTGSCGGLGSTALAAPVEPVSASFFKMAEGAPDTVIVQVAVEVF